MSDALVLEFGGVGAAQYREVNAILGIDPETGEGDWPAGLTCHTGAASPGGLLVFEVWESKEAQAAFMDSRLGPALRQVGLPEPARLSGCPSKGTTRCSHPSIATTARPTDNFGGEHWCVYLGAMGY